MTYVFESPRGKQIERSFSVADCPREIKVRGTVYRKIITPVGVVIPAYMRAPGSSGSSYDSCERQAEYLKSDAHRKNRAQTERINERIKNVEDSFDKNVTQKLKHA